MSRQLRYGLLDLVFLVSADAEAVALAVRPVAASAGSVAFSGAGGAVVGSGESAAVSSMRRAVFDSRPSYGKGVSCSGAKRGGIRLGMSPASRKRCRAFVTDLFSGASVVCPDRLWVFVVLTQGRDYVSCSEMAPVFNSFRVWLGRSSPVAGDVFGFHNREWQNSRADDPDVPREAVHFNLLLSVPSDCDVPAFYESVRDAWIARCGLQGSPEAARLRRAVSVKQVVDASGIPGYLTKERTKASQLVVPDDEDSPGRAWGYICERRAKAVASSAVVESVPVDSEVYAARNSLMSFVFGSDSGAGSSRWLSGASVGVDSVSWLVDGDYEALKRLVAARRGAHKAACARRLSKASPAVLSACRVGVRVVLDAPVSFCSGCDVGLPAGSYVCGSCAYSVASAQPSSVV